MANPSLSTLTDEALADLLEQDVCEAIVTGYDDETYAGADADCASDCRIVTEAARRLRARGTWQPIATAPKDDRDVLVANGASVTIGWHQGGHGWRNDGVLLDPQPTHWQPLPDPPKDTPDAEHS